MEEKSEGMSGDCIASNVNGGVDQMITTEVKDENGELKLIMTIKADKDGMVDMGNNMVCPLSEIKRAITKGGLSYYSVTNALSFNVPINFTEKKPVEDIDPDDDQGYPDAKSIIPGADRSD